MYARVQNPVVPIGSSGKSSYKKKKPQEMQLIPEQIDHSPHASEILH
jgi:hypothetical protein